MWFGAIARHPEQGSGCQLCEAGPARLCGDCFVTLVASYRALLRAHGHPVDGEPAWPLPAAHRRLAGIHEPEEQQP